MPFTFHVVMRMVALQRVRLVLRSALSASCERSAYEDEDGDDGDDSDSDSDEDATGRVGHTTSRALGRRQPSAGGGCRWC